MKHDNGPLAILTANEMMEVVSLPNSEKCNLIVAGYINFRDNEIFLFRGDGISLVVPMTMFSGRPTLPDDMTTFMSFEIYDIEEKGLSFQTLKPIANKVYLYFLNSIKENGCFLFELFDQKEIEDEIRAELKQCQWAKETLGNLLKD